MNVKAQVGAFNKEKRLVWASSDPVTEQLREGLLTALMETHHDHTRSCYDSHKHRYGRPTSTSVFLDNSSRKNIPSVDKMCQLLLLLFL